MLDLSDHSLHLTHPHNLNVSLLLNCLRVAIENYNLEIDSGYNEMALTGKMEVVIENCVMMVIVDHYLEQKVMTSQLVAEIWKQRLVYRQSLHKRRMFHKM